MNKDKDYYINVMKNFTKIVLQVSAEVNLYKNWSKDFAVEQINNAYKKLSTAMEGVDYTMYTESELKEFFKFQNWDEDLILIPIYLIQTISNGTVVYTISGNKIVAGVDKELDTDNRFGMSAYGFNTSQLRDAKLNNVLDSE